MGKFTVIPQDTFDALQLDAGVLLKRFDPSNPVAPQDEDLICATTGGIQASCVPTFSDLGSDVDNVPVNMKELKHLDSWEAKISTTSLGTSPQLIKMALGCADIEAATSKIVPRADLEQTDFTDIWWVGDKANGGLVAIQLKNALATSGFSLQTTKNGKGTISLELTGHVSIEAQKEVPMVFYSLDPEVTPSVTLDKSSVSVEEDETTQLNATTVPSGQAVTWSTSDAEVVSVTQTGVIEGVAEGTAKVTAAMVYGDVSYSDSCDVTVTPKSTGV